MFGENVQVDGGEHTKSLGKELAEKEKNPKKSTFPYDFYKNTCNYEKNIVTLQPKVAKIKNNTNNYD